MKSIIGWLEQYGLAAVFINVGLEQLGLPVPAYPVLILTGALRVGGRSLLVAKFSTFNIRAAPDICRA